MVESKRDDHPFVQQMLARKLFDIPGAIAHMNMEDLRLLEGTVDRYHNTPGNDTAIRGYTAHFAEFQMLQDRRQIKQGLGWEPEAGF